MPKPVLQALLLADHVYEDKDSGKKIIAGSFNRIWSSKFPTRFSRNTWAFVVLTDAVGRIKLEFQYRSLMTQEVLLHLPDIELNSSSPLLTSEIIVEVPGFPLPRPGNYSFDILWEKEILGSVRLTAAQRATEVDIGNP